MTASPPLEPPPLVKCLHEVRKILERARRSRDVRDIEQAIERIISELERERERTRNAGPRR